MRSIMSKLLIVTGILCVLAGCASEGHQRSLASAQIGCPENSIKVSNHRVKMFDEFWDAECKGKLYYCTIGATGVTSCKEAQR